MKVAVVGSRSFTDYELLCKTLNGIQDIDTIISGGAIGADQMAEKYAKEKGIPTIIYSPEWSKYGRSAGILRNKNIIENVDTVVAFWDGHSHGTKDSINRATKLNKELFIVKYSTF